MRNKNGFTLVELLAVVVVLAIIMILAIPSVIETMTNARKSEFVVYINKVITNAQNEYKKDQDSGSVSGNKYFIYDISTDLNLKDAGSYRGYVIVDATEGDNPKYIISIHDSKFILKNFDVTSLGLPTANTEEVKFYDKKEDKITPEGACGDATSKTKECYTRKGLLVKASE